MVKHHEKHSRTLVKAITWKIIASVITFFTTYQYIGDATLAAQMASTTFIAGLVAYYLHERVWNRIHWGKEAREW